MKTEIVRKFRALDDRFCLFQPGISKNVAFIKKKAKVNCGTLVTNPFLDIGYRLAFVMKRINNNDVACGGVRAWKYLYSS